MIEDQREYFNKTVESWAKEIDEAKWTAMNKIFAHLNIEKGSKVLDLACGAGVLYEMLKEMKLGKYTAVDISDEMLNVVRERYGAETVRLDFDQPCKLECDDYDHIILFNSIPHFENLNNLFENANKHMRETGSFTIAQVKSRAAIKAHHKKIGYELGRDAIPSHEVLKELAKRHGFEIRLTEDDTYFIVVFDRTN